MAALGAFVLFVVLATVLGAILALPVQFLINSVFTEQFIASIFGSNQIGFIKAWQLLILCGFLFKNTTSTDSE